MNEAEIANQDEMDREILHYVREMQKHADVEAVSVAGFLRCQRRRKVSDQAVADRLDYLTSAGYLADGKRWSAGAEVVSYKITADGMDLLDGKLPPRGWKAGN